MPEAVRRSMYVVQAEFDEMYAEARENGWTDKIPCHDNPGPFADWVSPPSMDEGEALCFGCPLKKLCRELGDVTKPSWGTWGGKVWVHKRSIYGIGSPGMPEMDDSEGSDQVSLKNAA